MVVVRPVVGSGFRRPEPRPKASHACRAGLMPAPSLGCNLAALFLAPASRQCTALSSVCRARPDSAIQVHCSRQPPAEAPAGGVPPVGQPNRMSQDVKTGRLGQGGPSRGRDAPSPGPLVTRRRAACPCHARRKPRTHESPGRMGVRGNRSSIRPSHVPPSCAGSEACVRVTGSQ
jgi:hypothetical protein